MTVARRAVGRGPSNKKNGVFWFTQVYRFTPAKQRQALRRLGCGGLRWLWRKPWRVGFLLDAVGQVTSQVNSEKALFSGSQWVGSHSGTQQNRPVLGAYRLAPVLILTRHKKGPAVAYLQAGAVQRVALQMLPL